MNKPVPLGLLVDIMTHALDLPPALKQELLAERSVQQRVDTIRSVLREATPGHSQRTPFPPRSVPTEQAIHDCGGLIFVATLLTISAMIRS